MQIVKVQYYSETSNQLSERPYSYYSAEDLKVGDIVTVPVRDTTGKARICAINLPESTVEAFKDKVKIIPAGSLVKEQTFPVEPEVKPDLLDNFKTLIDVANTANGNFAAQIEKLDTATAELNAEVEHLDHPENTAVIIINPRDNPAIVSLKAEIIKLSNYATARVIKCDEDIAPANNDLNIISKLKKALKEKQEEYVNPIKAQLDKVQFVFKDLLACLDDVDKINRDKVLAYRDVQKKRAAQAEELNRQAIELARKQAEFSGTGEFTVNTTPVEAAPVIGKVSSGMGTSSFRDNWKWKITDRSKIPSDYMMIDAARITKEVKAGVRDIPGLEIYNEETMAVRPH